ncbi:MAG: hypothetical protein ACTHK8_05810 [Ginsengibacter sp.]
MDRSLRNWISVSFFNLMLVAILGCTLRYKIAYSLPFINQKYLLNAHSHFAFSGWITQVLMAILVKYLSDKTGKNYFGKFRWIFWANLISAYGMLVTFPFQGYWAGSIFFSTTAVFAGVIFAVTYWKCLKNIPASPVKPFLKTALIFNVLSYIGPFVLAYIMITKKPYTELFMAAIYFFLHFQYNGWFLFTCMGLFSEALLKYGVEPRKIKTVFSLFAAACVPAYLLSALWIPVPFWVYILVIVAAFAQLIGWGIMVQSARTKLNAMKAGVSRFAQTLFFLSGIAYTLKLLLQAASAIPSLSHLSYSFRPIIIGYLHLVLLGVVTIFILAYIIRHDYYPLNKTRKNGVIIFVAGIIINEVLLMIRGIADMSFVSVPYINRSLLIAALILFAGMFFINAKYKVVDEERKENAVVK